MNDHHPYRGLAWRMAAVLLSCSVASAEELPWKVNEPIVTVKRELYRPQEHPDYPVWVKMYSTGPGLERLEVAADESSGSDVWVNIRSRVSHDNGRTWSEYEKLPNNIVRLPGCLAWEGDDLTMPFYDPVSGLLVQLWLRQIHQEGKFHHNFTYYRTSRDHGRTWSEPKQLKYESGADFDPSNPLDPEFLEKNNCYLGQNIIRHSNGTLLVGASSRPDKNGKFTGRRGEGMCAMCFIGRWNAEASDYDWTPGGRVEIPRKWSERGLQETYVAELRDGRVLFVWRGSSTPQTEGRKWYSVSSDGGKTLSPVQELKYDDGSRFYSPSSFHRLFRHGVTGKLYWIGNISAVPPHRNHPRYPLVIAEVDEDIPALKRDTVTAIADRKPGSTERFQLSNFSLLENPEDHSLEILMAEYDNEGDRRWGDCYKYTLRLNE